MDLFETTVNQTSYRDGMALLAAAVNIVTTRDGESLIGLTASAVCSVTDTPPTLLVCVNVGSSVGAPFADADCFCVNTIGPEHIALAQLFGGKTPMAERFAAAEWHSGASGAPMLIGSLVSFDCRIASRQRIGTHIVLYGQVIDLRRSETTTACAYFARKFHELRV